MKHNSRNLLTLLILSAFAASIATPVFAESRSATVRVSCTILPMLEMSLPKTLELSTTDAKVTVGTNLGKNFHVSEVLLKKPEGPLRLYSVTAL